ncbi:MAG: hypothetical protein MJ216_02180, partial [Bacilli bacterium]|nr:hypothetical protein [Bacilli bacterium]
TLVLFASLALTACGGGNAQSSVASECKTHKWVQDTTKENVPATCLADGITYQVCQNCGQAQEKKVNKLTTHTWGEDPDHPDVPASCGVAGVDNKKCTVCGATESTPIAAQDHEFQDDGAAVGVVHKEKCKNCQQPAYRFEVSEATGWNKADTKMNGKTSPDNQSAWALGGAVPAGTYSVHINTKMSYDSHSDRYFYNQWETDTASSPDKQDESPYRYYFQVDSGEMAYPMTKKSWGELKLSGTEFRTCEVEATVTITASSTEFHLIHGNIGYSLAIAYVRLVPIAK